MSAYMDARCSCGKRIGWSGKVTDRPACPRCGKRPKQEVLEREQASIEKDLASIEKTMSCGHFEADLCSGDGGSTWCGACALEAREKKQLERGCIVANLRRGEKYDVYIGRHLDQDPGRVRAGERGSFGNPFTVMQHGARALGLFEKYFEARLAREPAFRAAVLALRGKRLGCYCKPGPCHGDVIAAWVEANAQEAPRA